MELPETLIKKMENLAMIIRDLEHAEIVTNLKDFKVIEGSRFAFLSASFNNITIGRFSATQATIDTISQQGEPEAGTPSISGFSFAIQSFASSEPFVIA